MKLLTFRPKSGLALGLLGLTLAGGHAAQAQVVLSLLSPNGTNVYTTSVGSIVTMTVDLTGGTNLSGYNANILVNPAQLQFVNTAASGSPIYYASTNGSFFYLGSKLSTDGSDMNFTAGDFASANNTGINALGTFQVKVLSALTPGALTFGPIGTATGFNGTNVSDASGNNELTATTGATLVTPAATPEPSQTAAFGLGVLGLAGLALRARRAKPAC